jgi:hypothetical protein
MNGLFFGNLASGPQGEIEPALPAEYQRCEWVGNCNATGYFVELPTTWELNPKDGFIQYKFVVLESPTVTNTFLVGKNTVSGSYIKFKNYWGLYEYVGSTGFKTEIQFETFYTVRIEIADTQVGNTLLTKFVNGTKMFENSGAVRPPYSFLYGNGFYPIGMDCIRIENSHDMYYLVACYRKSDNVSGLYDFYNNTFYPATENFPLTHGANK